ncbi:CRISPR-associated endoribonuclease Cas6 [Romeria aff. gracilis LEGE 07310]|uniref:CRISPR-associated endoribonuclease Cas6 n=1 Tax=Vasconcelosia minhoensis LEGE 07310 TaxID=915328 RepID=A0A8J7DBA1_9CYAN|nr:CRISPR-associated endoribonuclease Cas6 [Romeria gracilis]MBE9077422.1 CRISPR-associated endoribonuclease Cas6 [Romeria aff. gracilis LEGE 07310]
MARSRKAAPALDLSARSFWPKSTELVSLEFTVTPPTDCNLYPQYTTGLHAWFLDQIRQLDADLSAYLHDGESEKPFSLSGLSGQFVSHSQSLQLLASQPYQWRVSGFSQPTVAGLAHWLRQLPDEIGLKNAPLQIDSVQLAAPPMTYAKLLRQGKQTSGSVSLSFTSPTSFRRKGHHLPLPWPTNVFHSYLRRWNHFASKPADPDAFLDWVDDYVIIQRHQMESVKVAAGKRGSVTGFTGAVTYGLDRRAADPPEFQTLFYALTQLAPYCGTGHKTTFGLGETQLGWQSDQAAPEVPSMQQVLAERIDELTALFTAQRQRQGGRRAQDTAEKWATILARREQGDSLQEIAEQMQLPYETAKTYSKLARRAAQESHSP